MFSRERERRHGFGGGQDLRGDKGIESMVRIYCIQINPYTIQKREMYSLFNWKPK